MSERPYCPYCYSRGFQFVWLPAAGRGVGKCVRFPCDHCGIGHSERTAAERATEKHYMTALEWFKTSAPPDKPMRLNASEYIVDPESLWLILRRELSNSYRLWPNRLRHTIIELYERLAVAEEL